MKSPDLLAAFGTKSAQNYRDTEQRKINQRQFSEFYIPCPPCNGTGKGCIHCAWTGWLSKATARNMDYSEEGARLP